MSHNHIGHSDITTYLRAVPGRSDVKINIRAALTATDRTLYGHDLLSPLILDGKERSAQGPLLLDRADNGAQGAVDLHLLETAGETASLAPERSDQMYDLLARVVHNVHLERSARAAAHPSAAVGVLLGGVDLLSHGVLQLVLVLGLAAEERLHDLHLLLHNDLVHLGEVLQTRRAVVWPELDLKRQDN